MRGATWRRVILAAAGVVAVGCSDPVNSFAPDSAPGGDAAAFDGSDVGADARPDAPVGPEDIPVIPTPDATSQEGDDVLVYAHTSSELFTIDPRDFAVMRVAPFRFPSGDDHNHQMTDIAVTSDGAIWGVTFDALYRIEPMSASCTYVSVFAGSMVNGLSFIPSDESGTGEEVLLAADRMGNVFRVDTTTGRTSRIGAYGANIISSGDIVSVRGAGTFATVVSGGVEFLARVNPMTGRASLVGATGEESTWGLGYWRGRIYGFTEGGLVVSIDIDSGRATLLEGARTEWWGAGVTTLAPTAPQ